jgi:hypothetical protein
MGKGQGVKTPWESSILDGPAVKAEFILLILRNGWRG